MVVFVTTKTTLFMHFAMPQPLVSIQCLLGMFSTFKNYKNPCMFSKLMMGLPNFKRWKRVTNCILKKKNLIVFLKLEVECHHVWLWHKYFHFKHVGYLN